MKAPNRSSYDVVIVGGAMYGSSVAWWLSRNPDFDGSILVVERDPSYEFASTSHTNSCIRQQFSAEVNVRISQFGAEFIHGFKDFMQDDDAPDIVLQSYGYMYLADNETFAQTLRDSQIVQQGLGAGTKFMTAEDIKLIRPARDTNGYRVFDDNDLHKLTFLARARALGFTIENCRALLALWEDQSRASADVKRIAGEHLDEIDRKIADLQSMRDTLGELVRDCAGDGRPDCPILTGLGRPR